MKGIKKTIVLLVLLAVLCAALAVAACANLPGGNTGTEGPGTETPGTEEPGTEEPGTDDPGTDNPGTDNPGTDNPGTDDPGTEEPDPGDPEIPLDKESCTHPHATFVETTEASCTAGGTLTYTCPDCEDTWTVQTEPLGHDFEGAACKGQKCIRCDATLPATASHRYAETANTATCTQDGEKTFTCQACGDTYTEPSLALGHLISENGWTEDEDSFKLTDSETCTYTGERTAHCGRCNKVLSEPVRKVIHTYEYGVIDEATCTQPGTMGMRCEECGAVQDESKLVPYTAEHKWDEGTEHEGYTLYTCQNAGCTATRQTYTGNAANVSTDQLVSGEVSVGDVVLSIDQETAGGLGSEVNVAAQEEDISGMFDEEVLDRVGDSTVYDLTFDGGAITNFDGSVTVKLPYTLAEGENPEEITIWYLNTEDSTLEAIMNAVYTVDENGNGYVTFTTGHFSYYTVGRFDKAEMCEKFGHLWSVSHREATCTEAGYHIEICARCDEINSTYTPALGHTFKESDRTDATCTEDGSVTYTCSVCEGSYKAVLKAAGHTWVLDGEESTAATCEAAGVQVYTCSACDATYIRTLPQLSHSYSKTVTAATCTAAGYTTYTCTRCGYSYKADYVAALGHTWNIAAPTCGEGQICTVCGAPGLPATGEHTMVNGVCTVCGQGCEHDWAAGAVTAPTCTEAGYTTYTCSKCNISEKRDYTAALGHDFSEDFTVCGRCGQANPQLEKLYENVAESLAAGDFAVTIDGLTLRGNDISGGNTYEGVVLGAEGVSASFRYEEGKVLISADGRIIISGSYEGEQGYPFIGYGDGTYFYVQYVAGGEEQYMRVAYSELMPVLEGAMGVGMGGGSLPVDSVADILKDQLLPLLRKVLDSDDGLRFEVMNKIFTAVFSGGSTKDGYEFTANVGKLRGLNEQLAAGGIASAFDYLFGDGAFDSLVNFVTDLGFDKSMRDAADELLGYAAEADITSDELFNLIDSVVIELSGDATFSIETILNDDQYANTTLATLLEQMNGMAEGQLEEMFDQYVEQFRSDEMSVYELITGGSEENAQMLKETVEAALGTDDKASVVLRMTTDAKGAVTGFDLTLDVNVKMVNSGSGFDYTLDGSIGVTVGGGAKVENASIASEFEGMWSQYLVSLRNAIANNGGAYTIGDFNFTVSGDKIVAFGEAQMSGYGEGSDLDNGHYVTVETKNVIEFTLPDLSACGIVMIMPDCGTSYQFQLAGAAEGVLKVVTERTEYDEYGNVVNTETSEEERGEGSGLYDLFGWYDPATGQFRQNYSAHNYIKDDEQSQTEEEVDCEEYYREVYVCENCGKQRDSYRYKSHIYEQKAELLEGSTSCEDGVRVFEECTACGEESPYNDRVYYSHIRVLMSKSFTINGETVTVYYSSCACGAESYFQGIEGGCRFTESVSREDIFDREDIIGYRETYKCYETGCDGRMVVEHYDGVTVGCTRTDRTVYTFYDGDEEVASLELRDTWTAHQMTVVESVSDDFGYTVVRRCTVCGYEESETEQYDEYGRLTLREDSAGYDGDMNVSLTEYNYLPDSCECEVVEYENGEEINRYMSTRHSEERFCEVEYDGVLTCTQPIYAHYLCKACGEERYSDTIVKGHSYEQIGEDLFECTVCGLQNAQGTDGDFIFEDLTDNEEYGREGYLALGYYDRYSWGYGEILFRFVPVGGESDAETGAGIVTYDIYYEDTGSILYISLDEVLAAAENYMDEEGNPAPIDLTQYDLRVTFPAFDETYSLTFTDLAERLGMAA